MKAPPLRSPVIIGNTLIGLVIGLAVGYSIFSILPGILCGTLAGALLGWLTEALFARPGEVPRRRPRRLLVLVLLEALLILYVMIPAFSAYRFVHPGRAAVGMTPVEAGFEASALTLTTRDGITIKAWYIPPQNGAVVIVLHGHSGNRVGMVPYAELLRAQGYGVLLPDMRAHGDSGGEIYTHCLAGADIEAAVAYLINQDPDLAIGLLGFSSGGHTSLCAMASLSEIRAAFVDGVSWNQTEDTLGPMPAEIQPFFFMTPANWLTFRFADWFSGYQDELSVREMIPLIGDRPVYFVAAGNDRYEPAMNRRFAGWLGPGASLWVIPGANHCQGYWLEPEGYTRRLITFFNENLH
ncbi:MAG: alpha/beta fold hydrolase [Anaerolineales bacterium]|nr:alpha/beta fold hydrolase [Anaerolineales bacterium]